MAVAFFIIGVSFSIFIRCGFKAEHYLIKDFDIFGTELTNPNETIDEKKSIRRVYDTLRNQLLFEIAARVEYQFSAYINNVSLINQCYATSVTAIIDNDILLEELELKLDSDIYFESEIIEKGTDLWSHPKLKEYRWFYHRDHNYVALCRSFIGFTGSFYDKVFIPQKEYTIEITCKTTDNLKISKSIKLYLKL